MREQEHSGARLGAAGQVPQRRVQRCGLLGQGLTARGVRGGQPVAGPVDGDHGVAEPGAEGEQGDVGVGLPVEVPGAHSSPCTATTVARGGPDGWAISAESVTSPAARATGRRPGTSRAVAEPGTDEGMVSTVGTLTGVLPLVFVLVCSCFRVGALVLVLACGSVAGGGSQRASGAPNQRCSVAQLHRTRVRPGHIAVADQHRGGAAERGRVLRGAGDDGDAVLPAGSRLAQYGVVGEVERRALGGVEEFGRCWTSPVAVFSARGGNRRPTSESPVCPRS